MRRYSDLLVKIRLSDAVNVPLCQSHALHYVRYELRMSFRFEHNFQMTDSIDMQVDDNRAGTAEQRKSMFGITRQVILILTLCYCGSCTLDTSARNEVWFSTTHNRNGYVLITHAIGAAIQYARCAWIVQTAKLNISFFIILSCRASELSAPHYCAFVQT